MKKILGLILLATASMLLGQKVKSKAEGEAVTAIFQAQTADQKIAAVEALVTKYKDTEFRSIALEIAAESAQSKGDAIGAIQYGERALEANPKNFQAMLLISGLLAQTTREFDLDKDEKVKKANKLATDAISIIASATKLDPKMSDDQWGAIQKDLTSQAHDTLGAIAVIDKKWDVAIKEYNTSISEAATPDAVSMVRLTSAYNNAGKYNEASATADKVIGMAGVPEAIKKVAQNEKARAEKGKAGAK